jgi:hypothetical protein
MNTRKFAIALLAVAALVLLTASGAWAETVSANGTCIFGTCGSPDTINPGQTLFNSYSGSFTLGNGDSFFITGTFLGQENSIGNGILFFPIFKVTYTGAGPSQTDSFQVAVQQFYNTILTSGTFNEGVFGGFSGNVGAGSSVSYTNFLSGNEGPPLGPFFSPSNFVDNQLFSTSVNPLLLDEMDYNLTFAAGSASGSTIFIDQFPTPEPASLLLLGTGLLGLVRRRRKLA